MLYIHTEFRFVEIIVEVIQAFTAVMSRSTYGYDLNRPIL